MGNEDNIKDLARLVKLYYKTLALEGLPSELINELVVGWQSYMLEIVKSDQTAQNKPDE